MSILCVRACSGGGHSRWRDSDGKVPELTSPRPAPARTPPGRPPAATGSPPGRACGSGSGGARCPSLADYVTVTGPKNGGGRGSHGNPFPFPDSHSIPTSISNEFPRIDVGGGLLGQDEIDAAIQTTSTSKVRRVDFGVCGPPQPPVGKQPPDPPGGCHFLRGR
jgi:hypothetical protein